jgi:two-component system cell cycle response regulator
VKLVAPLAPASARAVLVVLPLAFGLYLCALVGGFAADSDAWSLWLPFGLISSAAGMSAWRAVAVPSSRLPWALLALAGVVWAAAELTYNVRVAHVADPPAPSVADGLYLAFYPLVAAALIARMRATSGPLPRTFWIDGAIGVLATAAAAFVILGMVDVEDFAAGTLVNAAYPVADVLLLGLLGIGLALRLLPLTASTVLIAVGLVGWVVSDTAYLQLSESGTYVEGTPWAAGWPFAAVMFAISAWQHSTARPSETSRWRPLIVPSASLLGAVVALGWHHTGTIPLPGLLLATAAILLVVGRMAVTHAENLRLVDRKENEARTDALTGLANRRALLADLEIAVRPGAYPRALVLFDLDGFKRYNDTFGHPVGDELLRRLGGRLGRLARASGARAYRLGGDEFCLIAPLVDKTPELLAAEGAVALTERGEAFTVCASWGAVVLDGNPSDALREADRLMYERKNGGRVSAAQQTLEALLEATRARRPDLGDHVDGVADIAAELASAVGLGEADVIRIRRAAELHDIGKIAIPDAVLDKRGPLDESDWAFIQRHTVIGERILLAAEDLQEIAPMVRSSHERWDGGGYPDRLARDQIPLGARIIAVCDAFDAMLSPRPYQAAVDMEAAFRELRRCAGTQFDPAIVQAFLDVMERRRNILAVEA